VPRKGENAEENAKAAFLADFEQAPPRPPKGMDADGDRENGRSVRRSMPVYFPDLNLDPQGDGWWWRAAPADTVDWREMKKALDAVVKANIDPHGVAVAYMWSQYEPAAAMKPEHRDQYEMVEDALKKLIRAIPNEPGVGEFPRKWLREFRPSLERALKMKPPNDGTTVEPRRQAFIIAKLLGWKAAEIAGALVLTGAEKMDADRDFKAIRDIVGKAFGRFLKPAE
jgi:hypothetical protein